MHCILLRGESANPLQQETFWACWLLLPPRAQSLNDRAALGAATAISDQASAKLGAFSDEITAFPILGAQDPRVARQNVRSKRPGKLFSRNS